jgi:hypothetical protein
MSLKELIENKYGSVDKMIKTTNTEISRSYLYQLINEEMPNPSLNTAKELLTLLDLNTLEELMDILNADKEV